MAVELSSTQVFFVMFVGLLFSEARNNKKIRVIVCWARRGGFEPKHDFVMFMGLMGNAQMSLYYSLLGVAGYYFEPKAIIAVTFVCLIFWEACGNSMCYNVLGLGRWF